MAHPTQITYIGHATLLIEIDGVRVLTDPLIGNRIFHLKRQSSPVETSLYQGINLILISHLHRDHLDLPSLRLIGLNIPIIVPSGAGDFLYRKGFSNIHQVRRGEILEQGVVSIKTTYAKHHSKYPPFGPTTESMGYIIKGSKTVYFPGDTDLFPDMAHLGEKLDIALIPVWGWGPNLGPGHLDPERAVQALMLLHPRIAIPIHWGTFYPQWLGWFRPSLMVDPPRIFLQAASQQIPEVEVHILTPGSSITIH